MYFPSMDTRISDDTPDPSFSLSAVAEKMLDAAFDADDLRYEFESTTDCKISNVLIEEAAQKIKSIVLLLALNGLKANFSQQQITP